MNILPLLFIILIVLHPNSIQAKDLSLTTLIEPDAQPSLLYVSDYFAFMGSDKNGQVLFVLDNNRGRDGDTWSTEHLLVLLQDEHRGWVELVGRGSHENVKKELQTLPNTPFFQFQGTPKAGLTINSPKNQVSLTIDPIPVRHARQHQTWKYWMGSATGTLQWQGRTVNGLVIYEHLWMPNFNRLTRSYTDLWTESQGIYLVIGKDGDHLYLHSQQDSTPLSPLIGDHVGINVTKDLGVPMKNLQLKILAQQFALGFYQWPTEIEARWDSTAGEGSMRVHLAEFEVISNFFIGGLAMGIVTGEATINGQRQPVWGLAEVLR